MRQVEGNIIKMILDAVFGIYKDATKLLRSLCQNQSMLYSETIAFIKFGDK